MLNKDDRDLWRVTESEDDKESEQRPKPEFNRQQRRWAALGALRGALLIGAVYLLGLGIIIGLMVLFW